MQEIQQRQTIEEDEIDLRELYKTILKGKVTIAIVVVVVVLLTLIYALKLPNVYKSTSVLIPTESETKGLGGLGGLAAMAGISVGGGGSMTPDVAFNSLLNDYDFMKNFVINNKVVEHYNSPSVDENYVFAFGFRGIYDMFTSVKEKEREELIFDTVRLVKEKLSISSDKKTALISVSYSDSDRTYPPKIIEAFLSDASSYLVKNNLKNINSKLGYFKKELHASEGFELRKGISEIISSIIKEKVMMQSKKYYQSDLLTQASVAYVKDKTKPKRGLILVVSFITSIILGIFLVFFLEFLRNSKEDDSEVKKI